MDNINKNITTHSSCALSFERLSDSIVKSFRITHLKRIFTQTRGFMGLTHTLSALAVFMVVLACAPSLVDTLTYSTLETQNGGTQSLTSKIAVLTLFALIMGAGALLPDLDNTNSSAESSLGWIGSALSLFMRATAPLIQNLVHSRYDKDLDNPHRGFYHTTVSAVLCSVLVSLSVMWGGVWVALILAFIGVHITFCTLGKNFKLLKGNKLENNLISLVITGVILGSIYMFLPKDTNWSFVGVAFGVGWFIHILGDMVTTQGVPILWPLPIKGRMWWQVRLLKIRTGGPAEIFFQIIFEVIIVACGIYLVVHAL